jgi:hypothetical protein
VTRVRSKLSAAAIFVVAFLMTGASVVAVEAVCNVCVAKQHDCGKIPRLAQRCCGDNGDVSNPPGVTQAQSDVVADQSAVSVLPYAGGTLQSRAISWHGDTSPPRGRTSGLPILFADLRL